MFFTTLNTGLPLPPLVRNYLTLDLGDRYDISLRPKRHFMIFLENYLLLLGWKNNLRWISMPCTLPWPWVNQHPMAEVKVPMWMLVHPFELIDPDGIFMVFRNNFIWILGFLPGYQHGCWFARGVCHYSHTIPKILLCKTHYSRGCSIPPCGLPQFHQILICTKSSRRHIQYI